ncbi:YraN family protein [Paraburkholderia terrae]|uniref:YraN family protein n=1 Tax=Paraburkholderia sp. 22B1P TaxID=3080498 RepID=UPI001EE2ED1E|nr:YraN family protein [Paraburkholderia terrae]BEU19986.1 YraN family protein [Paraburkholderia sp. 22B1P]GJG99144.1 YraN family protein [Paraburkholderia terrae]GJH34203.1 YraN family protein [Paraburkholderia hospita]
MTRKTQTDEARPTLCHAAECARDHVQDDVRDTARRPHNFSDGARSKNVGAAFEAHALTFLQRQRLRFVARNVVCRGGEIDLVMREPDGALVFIEVRARAHGRYGGAAASVVRQKQQRIVRAAQHFLSAHDGAMPACRFDVIAFERGRLVWLRDAFRADDC